MTKRLWFLAVGTVVALGGLAAFFVLRGLDEADKWSSVLSLFFAVTGFALTVAGLFTRGPAVQSADGAVAGGSLRQIRGVKGDVVITGGGGGSGGGTAPAAAPASGDPDPAGAAQSARGARTNGDLTQIDGVDGSVRIGSEPPTS
ncbi:hypothetical protein [Streptomyces sp. NPDC004267]|uniref:hypothetical protein n=1 Tax=Streptomyces sp. NPDC004267 TaxID=3364694 RepID=UPI0036A8EDBD